MIAIIADDFTGAAELAGIALRYGLSVELFVDSVTECHADVMVVSTDSRSLTKDRALVATVQMVKQVLRLKPEWIYKKTDSVLRGYVVDELKMQLQLMGINKAFLLPANPSLGRTIVNGEYFIAGKRISETAFKNDPEFPVTSSFVTEILNNEVVMVNQHSALPADGIAVGEAATAEAVTAWAQSLDNTWLFAGAGDFFTALLERNYRQFKKNSVEMLLPHLYVCGTAFDERRKYIKQVSRKQQCVLYLQNEIHEGWLQDAGNSISTNNKLVIAVDESKLPAVVLRKKMAKAAKEIIERYAVKEIFIEGGSTAAAVLHQLQLTQLELVNEFSRGVVRMKADELYVTVKPGSYQLPEAITKLYS